MSKQQQQGKKRRRSTPAKKVVEEEDVETQLMRASIEKRLRRDAILRLILPTEEGVVSGSYIEHLRDYCRAILTMYERYYESQAGLRIESWVKSGIQHIIDHPDYCPKLALIFFTLSKEQWLADDFVPQPKLVYDAKGQPQQVPGGEPKVDPSKFVKYMRYHLLPLTQRYLNGEDGLDLQKYVHRAAFAWYSTGSDLSVQQQLQLMDS